MILGIDLGSTVFKAEVLGPDLLSRGKGTATVGYAPNMGNRIEMPVADTETAFNDAIADALNNAGIKAGELRAIAITSQAQTFTVRSPDGEARVPFISWRDTRCDARNRASEVLPDFAQQCSVYECLPLLMVAKLVWLQDESDGELIGTDDLVLMLPTWFVLQLTGVPAVDSNLAAMSGLYSLRENGWWREACHVCSIQEHNLPVLANLGDVVGKTVKSAERYGLPPGIPVALAGNDQTAGAFDAGIHDQNSMLISLGTAQVAYVVCPAMPTPKPGVMRGPYLGDHGYQLTADDHGAGTIHWARTVLRGCASETGFNQAAARATEDCGGVRFIADGPAGRGRWVGGTSQTTEADKARAVLVCLADRMAQMVDRIRPPTIEKHLLVAGGGSKSDVWLECLQQRLGNPLHRLEAASPARGAARIASACGLRQCMEKRTDA